MTDALKDLQTWLETEHISFELIQLYGSERVLATEEALREVRERIERLEGQIESVMPLIEASRALVETFGPPDESMFETLGDEPSAVLKEWWKQVMPVYEAVP